MTDDRPNAGMSQASSAFWIALWAFALAVLAAGADLAVRGIESRAERTLRVYLSPRLAPDAARREAMALEFVTRDPVARAEWISPREQAERIAETIPESFWPAVFSEEDAWLPWTLELQLAEPILKRETVDALLDDLSDDPRWRTPLFDSATLAADAELKRAALTVGAIGWAILFLFGAAALVCAPRPSTGFFSAGVAAVPAMAAVGALGLAAAQLGIARPDARAWAIAMGGAFALAGVLAPVLKGRRVRSSQSE